MGWGGCEPQVFKLVDAVPMRDEAPVSTAGGRGEIRVALITSHWKPGHSVYRNLYHAVAAMQRSFEVRGWSCVAGRISPGVRAL